MRRAAWWRRDSSTSTRTTTRKSSGIRRCDRPRITGLRRWSPATAVSPSRRRVPSTATSSSARCRTSRTWIRRRWPPASRGTSRRTPNTWTRCSPRGTTLNFTAYIGHSALRLYVMGDAAYERAATPDEIEQMCALVREAIEHGAAGFSTSFSFAHRGVDGKPVPSRFAERDEVDALFRAAGERRQGRGADHAGQAVHLRRRVRMATADRAPVHLSPVRVAGRQAPRAGPAARTGPIARRARCGRRSPRAR